MIVEKKDILTDANLLEGTINTKEIISLFMKTIIDIKSNKDFDTTMTRFYKAADNWNIVLIKLNKELVWMQSPLHCYKIKREFNFFERMKYFLNGILINKESFEVYAEIRDKLDFPIVLNKKSKEKNIIQILIIILQSIQNAYVNNNQNIAIYKKPYEIVSMNNVSYNIGKINDMLGINNNEIQSSIKTISISQLIKETINSQKEFILNE